MTTGDEDDPTLQASEDQGLAQRVAEELQRRIFSGHIPVGSWLRQDTVAADFNVSRTPVREAFRALQGQGVLEFVVRRGMLVRGHDARDIIENHQVRAELEGLAAALAATRITDLQLERLQHAADRFRIVVQLASDPATVAEAGELWRRTNDEFHATIREAADNRQLTNSIRELARSIPHNLSFATLQESQRHLRANAVEHGDILSAIESHDEKRAQRLLKAHVLRSGERIARRYEQNIASPAVSARHAV